MQEVLKYFRANSYKTYIVTGALYDEAKKDGWFVISMKNDWNRIL
jgi:hypothetical protein